MLDENYKKVILKRQVEKYNLNNSIRMCIPDSFIICYEMLDEIMRDNFDINIMESIVNLAYVTTVVPNKGNFQKCYFRP